MSQIQFTTVTFHDMHRLKVRDMDGEIEGCRNQRSHVMNNVIQPLLEQLGTLQETTILDGDFNFKVARQDYYLSKQKRMLQHLTAQKARHKFLLVALHSESQQLEKLQDILSATVTDMNSYQQEMDSRQDEIEHLAKLQPIEQRQTVDERDTFTRRLNCMLDNNSSKTSLASSTDTATVAIKLQERERHLRGNQEKVHDQRALTTLKLEELVNSVESVIFPSSNTVAVNTPKVPYLHYRLAPCQN